MFTNNYETYRKMMFDGGYDVGFTDIAGNTVKATAQYSWYGGIGKNLYRAYCKTLKATGSSTGSSSEKCAPGIYFGAGSTPATKNDYTLESPITSGMTIVNGSSYQTEEETEGKKSCVAAYSLKNTSDSQINIWEIGIFGEVANYSSPNYLGYLALFSRDVLNAPITLEPGEVKIIKLVMTYNQKLNVEA